MHFMIQQKSNKHSLLEILSEIFRLCKLITFIVLFTFMLLSVILTKFQSHSGIRKISLKESFLSMPFACQV